LKHLQKSADSEIDGTGEDDFKFWSRQLQHIPSFEGMPSSKKSGSKSGSKSGTKSGTKKSVKDGRRGLKLPLESADSKIDGSGEDNIEFWSHGKQEPPSSKSIAWLMSFPK
jgi:hypothetical protein